MKILEKQVSALRPAPDNERAHSDEQVAQIAESVRTFGFNDPIGIAGDGEIVEGEGRWRAAQLLGLAKVPTIDLSHLTPGQRRAYRMAHNKIALNSSWSAERLLASIEAVRAEDMAVSLLGFSDDDLARLADDMASAQLGAVAGGQDTGDGGSSRGDGEARGQRDYDYVPLNVIMSKDDRDRIYGAVTKAKAKHGLTRTDEALVAIVTEWEQSNASE